MENKKSVKKNYYVGLDIGTDSVGYAVCDEDYMPIKFAGEPMWGTVVFEGANQCAERRGFRTARRRLDRRQRRVALVQELFAKEILAIDSDFFIRIKESRLFAEDKTTDGEYDFLKNELFDGKPFHKRYPTIHHLIFELMSDDSPHDVRLVYMACAWLVAHRGHFLSEVEKENIQNILEFSPVYESFMQHFSEWGELPWECDAQSFSEVLKAKTRITTKEKQFIELLFGGKKPKNEITETMPYSIPLMIKLLSGGKVKASDFYGKDAYAELNVSLGMPEEEFAALLAELDEDAEIMVKLKALYDWAVLTDVLKGKNAFPKQKLPFSNNIKRIWNN